MSIFFLVPIILVLIIWLCTTIVIVSPKTGVLIQFFGGNVTKEITSPGFYFKLPFPIHTCSSHYSLATRTIQETVRIKTANEVFCDLVVNIFYNNDPGNLTDAAFYFDEPELQIRQITAEVIKEYGTKLTVSQIYSERESLSKPALDRLNGRFSKHGLKITSVSVQDPVQDEQIEKASNKVLAAKRENEASLLEKQTIYNSSLGHAEADAQSLILRTEAAIKSRQLFADSFIKTVKNSQVEIGDEMTTLLVETLSALDRRDMLTTCAKHGSLIVADSVGEKKLSTALTASVADKFRE